MYRGINTFAFLKPLLLLSGFLLVFSANAQKTNTDVYVDPSGVMRWSNNKSEVNGFGVNYSVPFAHAYRTAQKLGVDLKEAIGKDVYHFSRLDFDLFRIHVWDTEISDEEGNLLENEHLKMFDFLLKELKDKGINYVITPIAYWGNGWPEPDEDTPGFSNKYGKENSLTDPKAIKAQENYLYQFLNHVNPHTGVAYKDEPNLIAFEISNEPHHKGTPEEVTAFIQKMVSSMRRTGTKKPIFYNVSHSVHLAEAYFKAGIDGGTFQWYPTGLGFQKELEGNLLPNVNEYNIPFDAVIKENGGAKLVYEFDAADVNRSYIYPAMARSFREAGIQIATHFAYDPTFMAYANTEYNTHYMNLAYAPQKALALMISGKIFHELPMNRDQGTYPENLEFGNFRISYEKDLAVYDSGAEFIYTNTNSEAPRKSKNLRSIAGFGNSAVVKYEGLGAYFLDRVEKGVWRLEVMPDAIVVDNLFGKNSLDKTVAVVNWKPWQMSLELPDLGKDFSIRAINYGNEFSGEATGSSFEISPGTYLVVRKGKTSKLKGDEEWESGQLKDFSAPETIVEKTWLMHEPIPEVVENSGFAILANVVSNEEIVKVEAWFQNGNAWGTAELTPSKGYAYSAEVPSDLLSHGFLNYRIIVTTATGSFTYPSGKEGNPGDWDWHEAAVYSTRIVETGEPVYLFNAITDEDHVVGKWVRGLQLKPYSPGEAEYQVRLNHLFEEDEENKKAEPIYDYSFRYNFQRKTSGRKGDLAGADKLIVKARSVSGKPEKLQVALVDKDGAAFGKVIELGAEMEEHVILLSDLRPVRTVTLPRPYPGFLPYYFEHNSTGNFYIQKAESLQFSIGPGMDEEQQLQDHSIGIISVRLE